MRMNASATDNLTLYSRLRRLFTDRDGTAAVEYAVITSAIAIAAMVSIQSLGTAASNVFNRVANDSGSVASSSGKSSSSSSGTAKGGNSGSTKGGNTQSGKGNTKGGKGNSKGGKGGKKSN